MGILLRVIALAVVMLGYLFYAPSSHAGPSSCDSGVRAAPVLPANPACPEDVIGNAGSGGYDGIPVTPGDGIGNTGAALPPDFLLPPGPLPDEIGPAADDGYAALGAGKGEHPTMASSFFQHYVDVITGKAAPDGACTAHDLATLMLPCDIGGR